MSVSPDKENPFAPPKATVLEAEDADGEYIPGGRRVETGRGAAWFGEGWKLFLAAPAVWIGIFVVFVVLSLVLAIIPLGSLVSSLCYPVVVAGIMLGCRNLESGGTLQFSHLFEGFKRNVGSLLLVGILYLVGMMLIGFIAGIAVAVSIPIMAARGFDPNDFSSLMVMVPVILAIVLVVLALMLPLIMALWFAPALVVFHDVQPMAAMTASFQGCMKNFMPFLVYGVLALLWGLVALLPVGLGLLVYGPVLWGTMYAGYRDIFVKPA
jgi:hypothetical protein